MNLQLLSADIVHRVQGSPDSAHNLATVVASLIREEMDRDKEREAGVAISDHSRDPTDEAVGLVNKPRPANIQKRRPGTQPNNT